MSDSCAYQPSTVLFTIPKNALMNLNTLRPLYPQSTRLRLSAVQIISLHLLLHRPTGEEDSLDPAFGPYISTLPRDFTSHPLTWLASRKAKHAAEEIFLRNLPPNVTDGLHTLYARFLEDYQTICIYLVSDVHLWILIAVCTSSRRTNMPAYWIPPAARMQSFPSPMERRP